MDYSHEQVRHDVVNVIRLVRRLEDSIASTDNWDGDGGGSTKTKNESVWLNALGTLQKVKHGRKLLKYIEQYDPQPPPKQARQRAQLKSSLDRVETFAAEIQKTAKPIPQRPEPVLPRIPMPEPPTPEPESKPTLESTDDVSADVNDEDSVGPRPESSLVDPPSHTSPSLPSSSALSPVSSLLPATPTSTLLPSTKPTTVLSTSTAISTSSSTTRNRAQASSALHEELSTHLAQMATQLKHNALHFSSSLEKDSQVVKETQEKVEQNYATMLKERVRLRDFRGKSVGSTCLVIGIVVCVLALFVVMVGVIRFSRR